MKKLIVFYSRAFENYFGGQIKNIEVGNTEKVANIISELTGADKLKLVQKKPYAKDYQTCIEEAKYDLDNNIRPELINMPKDLNDYDEIYLGYPNYWGTMPMAVYSFLEKCDFSGKVIHPFCTHEGSGLSRTVEDIEKTVPGAIVKRGLAINGSRVDDSTKQIENWCE